MALTEFTKIIALKVKRALSSWSRGKRIDDFLENMFIEYNKVLGEINESYSINDLSFFETIEFIEQQILQSLKNYFNGHLYQAITAIEDIFQKIDLVDGFNISVLRSNEIWFRGRIKEDNARLYEKNEMFHIPNHMREKVNNQRFSFNGYPCLYLGKSIWACWEELNEPYLDDICFSALKLTEDIEVLDLSIPANNVLENKTPDELMKFLITLPLIISCSVKALNEKANFKSEYVVPQLLMVSLINSHKFGGYMFSSTKRNPALNWDESYLQNVVLPIGDAFDEKGLCISLKEKFHITDPICYKYEFLKSNISNMIAMSEQEIDAIFNEICYEKKSKSQEKDMYPRALFGQMEELLKTKEYFVIK